MSDLIDKQEAIEILASAYEFFEDDMDIDNARYAAERVFADVPTAEPRIVRCEECKFFELNHFDNLDGVPIITAHEICTKWGSGCKTDRNGYCFMAERRADIISLNCGAKMEE